MITFHNREMKENAKYVNSATARNQNECVKKFPTKRSSCGALRTHSVSSLIQRSRRELRQKFSSTIIGFLVNSQPPKWSEREENAKYVNSLWCESKMNVWNARQKKLLLSRARTHTTTVTQSTRSWNAPLDCSRHTSAGIALDADVPWCTR